MRKTLIIPLVVILCLILAFGAPGCRPGDQGASGSHPSGNGGTPPAWKVSDWRPDGFDSSLPLATLIDGRLVLSLPAVIPMRVLDISSDDTSITVKTDLPDGGEQYISTYDPQPGGNVTVLEVPSLAGKSQDNVVLLGLTSRRIDLRITLSQAVTMVNEFAATDFGTHPPAWFLGFADPTTSGEEPALVYMIDFSDAQTLNRAGTSAVAGFFWVDAASGEVTSPDLRVLPLGGTRLLAEDASFLAFAGQDRLLLRQPEPDGSDVLVLRTSAGQAVWKAAMPAPSDVLVILGVKDSYAYFQAEDGPFFRVSLADGTHQVVTDVPELPLGFHHQAGLVREDVMSGGRIAGRRTTLSTEVGGYEIVLVGYDDHAAERVTLEAVISRGSNQWELSGEVFEDYTELRHWYPCERSGTLYFTTEVYGPRYGMWVTEYALWKLVPAERSIRRVALMPTPELKLSPDGRLAVYQWSNKLLIISLTGS